MPFMLLSIKSLINFFSRLVFEKTYYVIFETMWGQILGDSIGFFNESSTFVIQFITKCSKNAEDFRTSK